MARAMDDVPVLDPFSDDTYNDAPQQFEKARLASWLNCVPRAPARAAHTWRAIPDEYQPRKNTLTVRYFAQANVRGQRAAAPTAARAYEDRQPAFESQEQEETAPPLLGGIPRSPAPVRDFPLRAPISRPGWLPQRPVYPAAPHGFAPPIFTGAPGSPGFGGSLDGLPMEHQISIRKQLGLSADGVAHYGIPVVSGHDHPRLAYRIVPSHVASVHYHSLPTSPHIMPSRSIHIPPAVAGYY